MRRKTKGLIIGACGASSYGTNPLFALPLFAAGISVNSVLFYRYSVALVLFFLWQTFVKKHSLKISKKQILFLFPLGIIFAVSSLTLFMSYTYIDAGIASTILFIYPVLVAVIMAAFFGEKISKRTVIAIILTSVGISLFYKGGNGQPLNLKGVALVLISALSYAVYMVAIKKVPAIKHCNYSTVTFYVMLFGLTVFWANLKFGVNLQALNSWFVFGCAVALAIFPTILSLETMTIAIKMIGPTPAAILGALEPLTAVFFGVLVFHEQMTLKIACGIALILSAVLIIVLEKKK